MNATAVSSLQASPLWPYLAASAVLPTFVPERLRGVGTSDSDVNQVFEMLMESAEAVKAGPAKGRWRLREDVRRGVLNALGSRENIHEALDANPSDVHDDGTSQALLELVSSPVAPQPRGRPLAELLALDQAVDWLSVTDVRPLPSREEIRASIHREKLFEPLRRLVVGFEGRENDLTALRSYVDTLPSQSLGEALARSVGRLTYLFRDHPPLVIYGPGGAGKSTLIAKFILDHAAASSGPPMAFVLLDFDRTTLDPRRPDVLMVEMASQLRVQFPEFGEGLEEVERLLREREETEDARQLERSDHYSKSEGARQGLVEIMNAIARRTGKNLLFVVDTFEIVQRRGPTAAYSLLIFIGELLADVVPLRAVLVGRAELRREQFKDFGDEINWQLWPLRGFDADAGRVYLRAQLQRYQRATVSDSVLDRLVLRVRGNPLCLRLAAQVFAREGFAGIEGAMGHNAVDGAIADELIQGLLHARIVEHLENDELKKIANPGLVVRRISADVIREVLAGPCQLDLMVSPAEGLFELLRNEGSLVEPVDADSVRHRPDVRQIMLSSLRRSLGPIAELIDNLAVTFWERFTTPSARAEEIYHRLWRNDAWADLEPRWMPDVGQFLEDALDEFETVGIGDWPRIWLSEKLSRELPDEIRKRSDQVAWERDIERKARSLLTDRRIEEARRVMAERPRDRWTVDSALWTLEVDALLLSGNAKEALDVISEALSHPRPVVNGPHMLRLFAQRVAALERLEDLEPALHAADEALALARTTGNNASIFSSGVTVCRLAKRSGSGDSPRIVALRLELSRLSVHPAVQQVLKDSPSLLREAVAALGAGTPTLVADAVERFGLTASREDKLAAKELKGIMEMFSSIRVSKRKTKIGPTQQREAAIRIAAEIRAGRVKSELLERITELYSTAADVLAKQVLK